jgi:hypothetical protein
MHHVRVVVEHAHAAALFLGADREGFVRVWRIVAGTDGVRQAPQPVRVQDGEEVIAFLGGRAV